MKNTSANQTTPSASLLTVLFWELSLLGHKTLDLVKELVRPGGWFRGLPHVRILAVLSMLIFIFDDDLSFQVSLGDPQPEVSKTSATSATSATAGFTSSSSGIFKGLFSSSAFAKTELTLMDASTGLALIERFEATALAEEEKLQIDAGVLLASAIAAGAVSSPEQVRDLSHTNNFFGEALHGNYPTAWASWRAMSLAVKAATTSKEPSRADFVDAAAAQFEDVSQARDRIYEALRFYSL